MHSGRIIVYIILIGLVAIMGYWGLRVGVRMLVWLSGAGIVFLVTNFFAQPKE